MTYTITIHKKISSKTCGIREEHFYSYTRRSHLKTFITGSGKHSDILINEDHVAFITGSGDFVKHQEESCRDRRNDHSRWNHV
jgi:hypothetical protein